MRSLVSENKLGVLADPDKATVVTPRGADAPRSLMFPAFIKPEHIMPWRGPVRGLS